MVKLGTSATFADLYVALTAGPKSDAWSKFLAAAKALPKIVNDDPFGQSSAAGKKKGGTAKGKGKGATRSNLHRLRR
jgi:hypothetical protein